MISDYDRKMFSDIDQNKYDLDKCFPFFSIRAPGMPPPGADFIRPSAALTGDKENAELYMSALYRSALYRRDFMITVLGTDKVTQHDVKFLPGGIWGSVADGPRPSRIMILGKHPGYEELREGRNFIGNTSEILTRALHEIGVKEGEYGEWYASNICRFVPPGKDVKMATSYVKNCAILLEQELRLVKPHYLLCLGDDAIKAMLGSHQNSGKLIGSMVDMQVSLKNSDEDTVQDHSYKLIGISHPARIFRQPDLYHSFKGSLQFFMNQTKGVSVNSGYEGLNLYDLRSQDQVEAWADYMFELGVTDFAVDTEWHGEYPDQPGAFLLTVQISWSDNDAVCIVLADQDNKPFDGNPWPSLNRVLKNTDKRKVRIIGHNFRSDIPWLKRQGLDLEKEFAVAASPKETANYGGFDTMIAVHAWQETHPLDLKSCAVQLLGFPRYDQELNEWLDLKRVQLGLKKKDFPGIGGCPDKILHHYGMCDTISTYRMFKQFNGSGGTRGKLDCDRNGNSGRDTFWRVMAADPVFMEIEENGMPIDTDSAEDLMMKFQNARDRLLAKLRSDLLWPDFNPNSSAHRREALFGEKFLPPKAPSKSKNPKPYGRPPGARSLYLKPLKTTGTRSKDWATLERNKMTDGYAPSTDKGTIATYFHTPGLVDRCPEIETLMYLNYAKHVLQTVLRPPIVVVNEEQDEDDEESSTSSEDVYEKGLLSYVRPDKRIHSHFFATCETGRARSFKPNLTNISSKREEDYQKILGDGWKPLRSIFAAEPGYVLVWADYVAAEAAVAGWLAHCPTLIDHVRRSALPSSHPDYYDIHSNTAIRAFGLQCAPSKKALQALGKLYLRVAAKSSLYGWFYGQSAEAAALKAREEGAVATTTSEAKVLLDWFSRNYPELASYFHSCENRVEEGFITNGFGRHRRFVPSTDRTVMGELKRQARNANIQDTVADSINTAMHNLNRWRAQNTSVQFRTCLQVHDSLILEVPIRHVSAVVKDAIPWCMTDAVDIWPVFPDGRRRPEVNKPYHLDVDIKVGTRWDVTLTEAEAVALGVPVEFAKS